MVTTAIPSYKRESPVAGLSNGRQSPKQLKDRDVYALNVC